MTGNGYLQLALYLGVLLLLVKPLGAYMANVYEGRVAFLNRFGAPFENLLYRLCGVKPTQEMRWTQYALAMLVFNLLGALAVYALQRLQAYLPLNPQGLAAVTPDSSFNTAVSFATNTNWQGYGGETTMSYITQMAGLTVQNFVSAATGMAVLVALIRGFARQTAETIGNFWVDLTRSTLYILLPLSLILALVLAGQGVVQTFSAYKTVPLVESVEYDTPKLDAAGQPVKDDKGNPVTEKVTQKEQVIAVGPAASQIAIKQLGTNGGGFFNVNSSHPLENPTPLSNFLELLAILLIPAALTYTFGRMVGDTRQGWAVLAAMVVVFVAMLTLAVGSEQSGNPLLAKQGVDQTASATQAGGNMEGKETRFGIVNSALWATATTAASNGSVNSMHDSFTPLGGLVPMWMMQLGEVIFGGVGSGLYGMLIFAIVAVFVAGLMIGRTPEYLGKKIQSFEMKMAAVALLLVPLVILVGTAIAVMVDAGKAGVANPSMHGFSEILYAFSSAGNNNGSAFAGLSANTPFYNTALGLAMLLGRYWLAVPVLAIAGALAAKKKIPVSAGTLPTHSPLFVILLIGTVVIVGALAFFPVLALGPIVEHLTMIGAH
ncbi:MAG: potassium-transporting ATPase subunit KdpA [Sulfuricaulis sp.]|uniref:potassium-transporting ATPase subunit KdpA n=1 Tax=Sulfuricaulis sp. TaxID=2003553 RepID=UPI003C4345DF